MRAGRREARPLCVLTSQMFPHWWRETDAPAVNFWTVQVRTAGFTQVHLLPRLCAMQTLKLPPLWCHKGHCCLISAYFSAFYLRFFKQLNKWALHTTRSDGSVYSHYWKGVILHLGVLELQLYTIINFCLVPIRLHFTLDVSTLTVDGSRLAIQHVLSCQSAACLGPTTWPINSYWLWHTCPSKMSSFVLIFPESCSLLSLLHPFMPAKGEIFILTDCICCVVLRVVLFCGPVPLQTRRRRELGGEGHPLLSFPQLCITHACLPPRGLSDTINELDSLVFNPDTKNQAVNWSCMMVSGG